MKLFHLLNRIEKEGVSIREEDYPKFSQDLDLGLAIFSALLAAEGHETKPVLRKYKLKTY